LRFKKQFEIRTARDASEPTAEQNPWQVFGTNPVNQAIHRGIVVSIRRQLIRSTTRNDEVGFGIELIPPEPCRTKWLLLEIRAQMSMKSTGEHEDSRSSPAKRHDCRTLVGGTVNASHDDPALQDCLFRFTLDLAEIIRRMVRLTECSFDGSKRCPKQTGFAVQPEPSVRIEPRLRIEGSGATRWFRCKASNHAPKVSKNNASRKSQ